MKRIGIAIAILVMFTFSHVIYYVSNKKRIDNYKTKLEKTSEKYHTIIENSIKEKKMEGYQMKNSLLFYEKDSSAYLKDIINLENTIVFWFDQSSCSYCIKMARRMIALYEGEKSIIGLCSFNTKKDFLIFKHYENFEFPLYHIEYKDIGRSGTDINEPFIALIDKQLNCSRFIIPDYKTEELLRQYFSLIAL